GRRRMLPHRADAIDEMLGPAIAKVVAIDARDHDVSELQRGNRPRQIDGLLGVERKRASVPDVAEWTAARAKRAHDHERGGAFAEALADVRARCFFAHRVQMVLAQNALDVVEAGRAWRASAYPRGLLEP